MVRNISLTGPGGKRPVIAGFDPALDRRDAPMPLKRPGLEAADQAGAVARLWRAGDSGLDVPP